MTPVPAQLIDGETSLMGLIGQRISYSFSPLMHNRAAAIFGKNIAYLPVSLPESQLKNFLDAAWCMGAVGFNVTQPHKGHVAKLIGSLGRQSINTLYRGQVGWLGASTDGPGFSRAVHRMGRILGSFEKLVLLGSGGAVLSILEHMTEMSSEGEKTPSHIVILRRNKAHDHKLYAAAEGAVKLSILNFDLTQMIHQLCGAGEETLFVQATSAPLHGDSLSEYVSAIDGFQGLLVDLVYGRPSALYFRAIARDLNAQDGEPMLIEQARLSQEIWWGKSAPYDDMALAIRRK